MIELGELLIVLKPIGFASRISVFSSSSELGYT